MPKERRFWTGSTNILSDPRPSALDLRVYGCVSMHDGMSLLKGTGMGCYARLATIAAEVDSDIPNVSKSLKRLVGWEHLTEERQRDARRKAYRVRFDSAEHWRNRQQSQPEKLGQTANKLPYKDRPSGLGIVGEADPLSDEKISEIDEHYISLKELDSSEEGKIDSPAGALCAPNEPMKYESCLSIDANMALLHRALKAGAPIDVTLWCPALLLLIELADNTRQRNQAHRLYQELVSIMTEAELATSREVFEAQLRVFRRAKINSIKDDGRRMKRF